MKRGLSLISLGPVQVSAFAYFFAAAGIYFWVRGFIAPGLITLPKSLENIFWLLVVVGLVFCLIAEGVLLVKHREDFRTIAQNEIDKNDLIKKLISFFLTMLFSYIIYIFVINRKPNLVDPMAFLGVSAMIYFASAAISQNVRYIPLFFILFRSKHECV